MNSKLSFGIITLQQFSWTEITKIWQKIEHLGFDSVWLDDHFVNYRNPSGHWFDCWTLLAALSTGTTRIRVGTLVSPLPLYHPAKLARQAMTVDHISNGRLNLGIGTGVSGSKGEVVYSMIGIEDWPPAERVARFEEAVQIIDKSLRQPRSSFEGKYYQVKDNTTTPLPVQNPRPPITIGAMGKSMLRIAARYADTWSSFGGPWNSTPEEIYEATKNRIALIDSYCLRANRDPHTLKKSLLIYGSDSRRVFASEDDFREIVTKYTPLGITEFICYYPSFDLSQVKTFEMIATEVIPEFRNNT
ncbi:MAG: LLM class flavin-dependent oxidoreductase [Candidatus Hodarchaeales archaeon]|jgi:alkanesulfonate monooxygenase SsuD/methylene tetrahydromethanopterin reductase-like flavin-dependent oxidoreductase (luciferase family)